MTISLFITLMILTAPFILAVIGVVLTWWPVGGADAAATRADQDKYRRQPIAAGRSRT